MTVLVTGAAGFIGYHAASALLARGDRVVGVDNLSPYYDVRLKRARLERLADRPGFTFVEADVADREGLARELAAHGPFPRVVHLAAQAGVRYALQAPFEYVRSNLVGQLAVLELCRAADGIEHLVYASTSSVYGGNTVLPFSENDRADDPVSLYAATKGGAELMSRAYAHLFGIPQTAIRFFTVYGPWGRPDMALFLFTRAILAGEPVRVFNHGNMWRDFTYIDDAIAGLVAALDRPPGPGVEPPHKLYNLGNNARESVLRLIELVEAALGRNAETVLEPMQPGDVRETFADIEAARRDLGFEPRTQLDEGVERFVAWYRGFYGV